MKIQWSGLGITEGRGRIGGNIASRNGSGAYLKKFTNPINPQTVAQQIVRAIFGAISAAWRSLTELQQNEWNFAATLRPQEDSLGNEFFLSGFGLFNKLQNALEQLGKPGTLLPGPIDGVVNPDDLTLAIDAPLGTMVLDWTTNTPVGTSYGIYATAPLSPGRRTTKNDYRLITVFDGTDLISEVEVSAAYDVVFGGQPTAGQRVTMRVMAMIEATGVTGLDQFPSDISS